jgi:hypothetical protein
MAKRFTKNRPSSKRAASPAVSAAASALVRLARLLARQAAWEVLSFGLDGKDTGVAIPIPAMDSLTTTKKAIR